MRYKKIIPFKIILREGLPNNVKLNVRIEHYVNGKIQKNNSRLIDDIIQKKLF